MDARWPRTRRFRRMVRRFYPAELEHLRGLLPYLTGSHPEWPAEATAAEVVQKVDALLSMNHILCSRAHRGRVPAGAGQGVAP